MLARAKKLNAILLDGIEEIKMSENLENVVKDSTSKISIEEIAKRALFRFSIYH